MSKFHMTLFTTRTWKESLVTACWRCQLFGEGTTVINSSFKCFLCLQNAIHLHKPTKRGTQGISTWRVIRKLQLKRTVVGGEGKKNYPTRRWELYNPKNSNGETRHISISAQWNFTRVLILKNTTLKNILIHATFICETEVMTHI